MIRLIVFTIGFCLFGLPAFSQDLNYLKKLETWRRQRNENLKKPYGWLSVSGLTWLTQGKSYSMGSSAKSEIRLARRFPKQVGEFKLDGAVVVFKPAHGVPIQEIKINLDKDSDLFEVYDLRFQIIKRTMGIGVRLRDPQSLVLKKFKGLKFFQPDISYQVHARFIADAKPTKVMVTNSLGADQEMTRVGAVEFKFKENNFKLVAFQEDAGLFIIFKDLTSGKQTYAPGRFLETELPTGDSVILDFNYAYNPPCAFNRFTTCPFAPRENYLSEPILAGEKYSKN